MFGQQGRLFVSLLFPLSAIYLAMRELATEDYQTMFWQASSLCHVLKTICLSTCAGKGRIDDEKTERKRERERPLVEWHRFGCLCGTSKGNASVISLLPDLCVLQYETQMVRMLPIRNYMLCKQRRISHYSLFT